MKSEVTTAKFSSLFYKALTNHTDDNDTLSSLSSETKVFLYRVVPTILCVVCLIGLVGNLLVLYVMNRKMPAPKQQRSITDIYVTNLALADFLFVLILPFWIVDFYMSRTWVFGVAMCKISSVSSQMHMYAGVFFISTMAIDRVMAVVFYVSCGRFRTKRNAKTIVAVIWLISIALSFLGLNCTVVEFHGTNSCQWNITNDVFLISMRHYTRTILGFFVPLTINCICSITIAVYLKNKKALGRLAIRRQKKATKVVLLVVVFFIICWLPNQISNFYFFLRANRFIETDIIGQQLMYIIHMSSVCLLYGQSCINPVLYGLIREDLELKTQLIQMMRRMSRLDCFSCFNQLSKSKSSRDIGEMKQLRPPSRIASSVRIITQTRFFVDSSLDFHRNSSTVFIEDSNHTQNRYKENTNSSKQSFKKYGSK